MGSIPRFPLLLLAVLAALLNSLVFAEKIHSTQTRVYDLVSLRKVNRFLTVDGGHSNGVTVPNIGLMESKSAGQAMGIVTGYIHALPD
jgi:hypothetical protein